MMAELLGDQALYQWDSGRQVQVPTADFVHFANYGDGTAHVVKPEASPIEGECLAEIPNDLLATGKDVLVWRYADDHTLDSARLRVIPRAKPEDYVYEDNVPTLTELIQSLIDDSLGEVVKGEAATITVGKVETVPFEDGAGVVNSGTESDAILDFRIPAGQDGKPGRDGIDGLPGRDGVDGKDGAPGKNGEAASISIGQVTTGEPGTEASVVNTGTATDAILDITIPRGEQGIQGEPGAKGERGEKGDKGDPGDPGAQGPQGPKGADGNSATINGKNSINLNVTDGLSATQDDSTYTISASGLASKEYVTQTVFDAISGAIEGSY